MPVRGDLGYGCIVLLLICACSKTDVENETQNLLETDRAFAQAALDLGPSEAFNQFLAVDALQLANGSLPIQGRELIRKTLSANEPFVLKWHPQSAVVSKSMDIGYTWGHYEAIIDLPDNETISTFGKYLNVWHRDSTGRWYVKVDMSNQDPAPSINLQTRP